MARSRNIKPAFFNNDELAEIEPLGRLFFIGLWTIADYKGCFEWRPKKLKVQLLPYDNCDIEKIAINLDKSGFIRFYSVQGVQYAKITNFEKHQNPHKNEKAKGSSIPDIDKDESQPIDFIEENKESRKIAINPDLNGTNPADSFNLIPDSLQPDSYMPKEKATPKITISDIEQVQEGYNTVISNLKPNWQKLQSISDNRKKMIKAVLKIIKPRAESFDEKPVNYLVRLLEEMAQDEFFSGKPSNRNPQGFNCSFETNFRQERICQAIDKFAGESA